MEKIRTFIVCITAWFSFLAVLWLYLLNKMTWYEVVIMAILTGFVFGLSTTITPKKY